MASCVKNSMCRRLTRSAMSPAMGIMSSTGPNCRASVTPTAAASLWVSLVRTIQSWAVRCIHVPDVRHERADEEEPEVVDAERAERADHESAIFSQDCERLVDDRCVARR